MTSTPIIRRSRSKRGSEPDHNDDDNYDKNSKNTNTNNSDTYDIHAMKQQQTHYPNGYISINGQFQQPQQQQQQSNDNIRHSLHDMKMIIQRQISGSVEAIKASPSSTTSSYSRICSCLCSFLCRLFQLLHTIAIILLILTVLYLYEQINTLKEQLMHDEDVLDDIQNQLKTQQVTQEHLNIRVEREHSLTIYQLAGTFMLLTCLITMFHMTQHMNNWAEPVIQRKIIAILWLSPIYSITSFLSLIFIPAHGYLAIIKDLYEAYAIYVFLSFLIAVLGRGNRDVAIITLSYHADHLPNPTRCFNTCYHPPPSVSDQAKAGAVLLECQIWAMQFVLLRPMTSIVRFMLENYILHDDNSNGWRSYVCSPFFVIDIITNISVFLAFHGLLKFYHTVYLDLQWCQPFRKFMTIKGIVFLTFWQGLLIIILCNINQEEKQVYVTKSTRSNITSWNNTASSNDVNAIDLMDFHNRTRLLLFDDDHRYRQVRGKDLIYRLLLPNDFVDKFDNVTDETLEHLENATYVSKLDNFTDGTFDNVQTNIEGGENEHIQQDEENNNDPHNNQNQGGNDRVPDNSVNNDIDSDQGTIDSSGKQNDQIEDSPSTNATGSNDSSGSHAAEPNTVHNGEQHYGNYEESHDYHNYSARDQAAHIQNLLICLEMLLFSIAHWCVFPAEEWSSNYMPKTETISPGIALKDFASDISYIVSSSSSRRAYNKQKTNNLKFLESHNDIDGDDSNHRDIDDITSFSSKSKEEDDEEKGNMIGASRVAIASTNTVATDSHLIKTYRSPSTNHSIVSTDLLPDQHTDDVINIRNSSSINPRTVHYAAAAVDDEEMDNMNDPELQQVEITDNVGLF